MPELPEVEVLTRHLDRVLAGRRIHRVTVRRAKVIRPNSTGELRQALVGGQFVAVTRRGKYLVFRLRRGRCEPAVRVVGHLGMTGRMYLMKARGPLPRHAALVLSLEDKRFVFEDTRYFGRFMLDVSVLDRLGPEPLTSAFSASYLMGQLRRSSQAIKVKLLDQALVAGVGNIYASEALFRARISPSCSARKLGSEACRRLSRAIKGVLREAIAWGSTVPLSWAGDPAARPLFYYGQSPEAPGYYEERLRVYDRAGETCPRCREGCLRRIVQAGRSTFFCPQCQPD